MYVRDPVWIGYGAFAIFIAAYMPDGHREGLSVATLISAQWKTALGSWTQ